MSEVAKLREIVDEWRDQPEVIANFIRWNNRFHDYSPFNRMLILAQRPDATRCAGFKAWESLGRRVKGKGTGIKVFFPKVITERDENGDEIEKRVVNYGFTHTYDIANTVSIDPENDEYDKLVAELRGESRDLSELSAFVKHFAKAAGVDLVSNTRPDGALFVTRPGYGVPPCLYATEDGDQVKLELAYLAGLVHVTTNGWGENYQYFGSGATQSNAGLHENLTIQQIDFHSLATAWAIADRFGIDVSTHVQLFLGSGIIMEGETFNAELLRVARTVDMFERVDKGVPYEWAKLMLDGQNAQA